MGTFFNPITGDIVMLPITINPIGSYPSETEHRISNMYVDSATDRIMISYSDDPGGEDDVVRSEPPTGSNRVLNMFTDSNGRVWVSYDDDTT